MLTSYGVKVHSNGGLCFTNCFHTVKLLSDFQTRNSISLSYMATGLYLLQLKLRSVSGWDYSVENYCHILAAIF